MIDKTAGCKNCSHWDEKDEDLQFIDDSGGCMAIQPLRVISSLHENIGFFAQESERKSDLAAVISHGGDFERLVTRGDFFCCLHKPKDSVK